MSIRHIARTMRSRRGVCLGAALSMTMGPLLWAACTGASDLTPVYADAPNVIRFEPRQARSIRLVILSSSDSEPCLDELEVLEEGTDRNLALAAGGAVASASSCLSGYAAHRVSHLNDGRYGNGRSWVSASAKSGEWAQIDLPNTASVSAVVYSRDREARFYDRVPLSVDVMVSADGRVWEKAAEMRGRLERTNVMAGTRSIPIPLQHARYVRLSVLGTEDGAPPALDEVAVYGREADRNLASPAEGARVRASSTGSGDAKALTDGATGRASRWQAAQARSQHVSVELAERTEVTRLTFTTAGDGPACVGRPTVFSVDISLDGDRWKSVHREGWGSVPPPPPLSAPLHRPDARASAPRADSLGYANLALRPNVRVTASSVIEGHADLHTVPHLIDGQYGNARSWIPREMPCWVDLDLGAAYYVHRLVFGSDSTGGYADRAATAFRIMAAAEKKPQTGEPAWQPVFEDAAHPGVLSREEFTFKPIRARWVRLAIDGSRDGLCRIDEIEVYGSASPIAVSRVGPLTVQRRATKTDDASRVRAAFLAEEYAWLKTYGRADLDARLTDYIRVWNYPEREGEDVIPLPDLPAAPSLTTSADDDEAWRKASQGAARVAYPDDPGRSPLVEQTAMAGVHEGQLYFRIRADRLLSRHLAVLSSGDWSDLGVILTDEDGMKFVQYRPGADGSLETVRTTPLAGHADIAGGRWTARIPFSVLSRSSIYGIRLGLGLGGRHTPPLGRGIHMVRAGWSMAPTGSATSTFSLRLTNSSPEQRPLRLEAGGVTETLTLAGGASEVVAVPARTGPIGPDQRVRITDGTGQAFVVHLLHYRPLQRAADLLAGMIQRMARRGLDVSQERLSLAEGRRVLAARVHDALAERRVLERVRLAKRRLMLRDPDLTRIERVLAVRRHNFEPSHNYSDLFDATGGAGGSVDIISIPRIDGVLTPGRASSRRLCDAGPGIIRDASASDNLRHVYFAWRKTPAGYYHLMRVGADGSGLKQLTDGPFHDVYPTPLPNGELAFISTRCRARYLCWRPQAYVLFRLGADGSINPLSYANLSEWAPSVMRDGRLLWTRSEYQDKGADFSHTLWAVRPDGAHAELIFGNTIIQPNGYANGREVPGSREIICTLISHFGDLNGPLALLDPTRSRFSEASIHTLTPEVPWPGLWPSEECFRDPEPISRDVFLCSYAPNRRFQVWLLDRFGNREVLYEDPHYSVMCPTPFTARPPRSMPSRIASDAPSGEFLLADVYQGLNGAVPRGSVKWLRITQEVRADLQRDGAGYRTDHPEFMDWYATPTHLVSGPNGWPSFVAKASWGLVPVAADGSARFQAPAGKVLYFSILDANFDEIQRMRSVVQLAPGEKRGCVGCHESRSMAPPAGVRPSLARPAVPVKSAWDGRPFWFERDVQPVLDKHCAACHDDSARTGVDLSGQTGPDLVPMSYRTLIEQGWVHYLDWQWNAGGNEKAAPLTFGTVRSPLWRLLDAGHHGVRLSTEDRLRLKTWTDLNCPLWGDYQYRPDRASASAATSTGGARQTGPR